MASDHKHCSFSGLCLVAVYLIGGFLYQRLIVGAKGMEQFPNYTFWVEFGNLTAVSAAISFGVWHQEMHHPTWVNKAGVKMPLKMWLHINSQHIFPPPSQDGCDFVCRSRNREEPPAYRGVATEPLEEEPEERDDHLLPMWPQYIRNGTFIFTVWHSLLSQRVDEIASRQRLTCQFIRYTWTKLKLLCNKCTMVLISYCRGRNLCCYWTALG